ncbi:MAG: YihA family ribosome biogenesis GTP-binding protein [Acidobacteria bacterium]|nr:YihA family ribosome biogenesis GTP-binding protein [Acidobacteriota bacterium]
MAGPFLGLSKFVKIHNIERTLRTRNAGHYPDEYLPEIAFIGRSNVGKSSLINSLLSRKKLAATSRTPGKTRAIDWFRIDRGGRANCFFVDLPGYGFAKVPKKIREEAWARLIDTYLESDRPLVLALQLLDMRRLGPTKLDEQMIKWLCETRLPHAFILTKADKLKRSKKLGAMKNFEVSLNKTNDHPLIPYSAVTGEGKNELWSLINQSIAQTQ